MDFEVKKRKKDFIYSVNNEIRPPISITNIANHIKYQVKIGNSRKRIKKTIANPTSDPPLACCLLTIQLTSFIDLVFFDNFY